MIINRIIECVPDLMCITHGLLERFKTKYEFTCSKKYGFILKVNRIVKINACKISIYNGNAIIDCDIDVECLIPQTNQILNGKITHIYPQGIIVMARDCMKIFIPTGTKSTKKIGSDIDVIITQIRFQKGKYDCIAIHNP